MLWVSEGDVDTGTRVQALIVVFMLLFVIIFILSLVLDDILNVFDLM